MINKISTIPSFVSQAQLLIPIMHNRLSSDPNKKIILSKSLSAPTPFIIPIEEANSECITLEEFLAMLDIRINAEFAYREEITQLRDNLCGEFDKLCDGTTSEDFIKFVRDQKQRIINAVIDETKIEQKMIAEQFYNDMLNGWDEKALGSGIFSEIVYAGLWKPLLTPLPIRALDQLRELISKFGNEMSNNLIEKIASQLISYIKAHLDVKVLKDTNFKTNSELRSQLELLAKERKICVIEVNNLARSDFCFNEFANICIEKITLATSKDEFLKSGSKFNYDELNIKGANDIIDIEKVINKVRKTTRSISFKIKEKINYEKLRNLLLGLEFLISLNLDLSWNDINVNGIKELSAVLKNLKSISILNLNLGNNKIGNDGVTELSECLKELTNLSNLNLDIEKNNIGDEGAITVVPALHELKNFSTLALNIANNEIGEVGIKRIADALKELKHIATLHLNFGIIGEKGTKTLSTVFYELKNISSLALNLWWNKVGKEGVKIISEPLKDLEKISTLKLNLGYCNILDEGIKTLSTALQELKNISTLNLHLGNNNIGDEGAMQLSAALKELQNMSILDLNLRNNDIEDVGGKTISVALKELKNVSILSLNFEWNKFKKEGAIAISAALKEMKNISTLDLNLFGNVIGQEGQAALSELQLANPNYQISS